METKISIKGRNPIPKIINVKQYTSMVDKVIFIPDTIFTDKAKCSVVGDIYKQSVKFKDGTVIWDIESGFTLNRGCYNIQLEIIDENKIWRSDVMELIVSESTSGEKPPTMGGYGVNSSAILVDGLVGKCVSGNASVLFKNTLGYVTDGLQMLFDGEFKNYIGFDYGWKNQISGEICLFTGNEHKTDKSFIFDKATYLKTKDLAKYEYPTVEVVFKPAIAQSSEVDVVNTFESGGYGICLMQNKVVFSAYIGKYLHCYGEPLTVNEIYSVSGSYDGEKILLAQNGVLYTQTQTGIIKHSGYPLEIGRSANTNSTGYYFQGEIYCVRVYNRALTEAEIQQNYAIDRQRFEIV